jgi:hypothetical protein
MHRTQVLLEETQYQALIEQARREGKSMGELVREFVSIGLASPRKEVKPHRHSLSSLKGMVCEPGVTGRDHDRYLYGEDK